MFRAELVGCYEVVKTLGKGREIRLAPNTKWGLGTVEFGQGETQTNFVLGVWETVADKIRDRGVHAHDVGGTERVHQFGDPI